MEKYNTLTSKKDYDLFLSNISHYLEMIRIAIRKTALDFSADEVREVSKYFIDLKNNQSFSKEHKKQFIAYLGESFIKKYGGIWFFTGLKKDSFAINEPVITKYKNEGIRKSPSETIFKIFEKDDDNYFNWANNYMEEFQKKTDGVFSQLFPKKKKGNVPNVTLRL